MKRGGDLHPAKPPLLAPNKAAPGNTGTADRRQRDVLFWLEGCAPVLVHVPSFWRNPRVLPDYLAYPVPKACMHVLGTGVPRRLGVARSASSPKAAQALGCSLTPGLQISFGRVSCMARAASVPGHCHWVSYCCVVFVLGSGLCLGLGFGNLASLAGVLGGCVWVQFVVSPLFAPLGFLLFAVGLGFRPTPHLS